MGRLPVWSTGLDVRHSISTECPSFGHDRSSRKLFVGVRVICAGDGRRTKAPFAVPRKRCKEIALCRLSRLVHSTH